MIRFLASIFLCILFFVQAVFGQVKSSLTIDSAKKVAHPPFRILNPHEAMQDYLHSEELEKDSAVSGTGAQENDPRLDSVQLAAWKSYYDYMNTGYKHRAKVFAWQLISSCIIFCMVIFLVLCGVYFAWLQFKLALKQMQKEQHAANSLATELSASAREIKLSSPVLGVIILVISLLFFYLYLVHVYPIDEIF